nr:aldo/keto reductase [Paenibacillus mucilaginosus]
MGIHGFDTTYYQERVHLGRILEELGRREEAMLMAWNFFQEEGREQETVSFTPYEPHHLAWQLEELRTTWLDMLVIHVHDEQERLMEELSLAAQWVRKGKIRQLALGMARAEHVERLPESHQVSYILTPYNFFHRQPGEAAFRSARQRGIRCIALSPFVRGWKLEKLAGSRADNASLLLRWLTGKPEVDGVVVSMRNKDWVGANLAAERAGQLSVRELQELEEKLRVLSPDAMD